MKPVLVAILLIAALACGGKKSPPAAHPDDAGGPPPPAIDAAPTANLEDAEGLWQAYRDAHVGATKANADATGRRIDALLSAEARQIIADAAEEMTAALPSTLDLHGVDVRFKILGEGAAARSARITRAVVSEMKLTRGDTAADITVRDGDTTLVFTAVREGNTWHLGPSPDLLVKEDELFQLPSGGAETNGSPTVEAVAARWVAALNGGTGWDAYNAIAPSNRAKLKALVAQMGGSGDEDVVRILDKTIRDRRDRGIKAIAPTMDLDGDDDHRAITFHYSDGGSDDFAAVREDGAWWIVMPL